MPKPRAPIYSLIQWKKCAEMLLDCPNTDAEDMSELIGLEYDQTKKLIAEVVKVFGLERKWQRPVKYKTFTHVHEMAKAKERW